MRILEQELEEYKKTPITVDVSTTQEYFLKSLCSKLPCIDKNPDD